MSDKPWLDGALEVKDGSTSVPLVAKLPDEPQISTAEYAKKRALEAVALGIGGIADAPSRVFNLAKAAYGKSMIPQVAGAFYGQPSDYMPEITPYNRGTDALKQLLSVSNIPQPKDQETRLIGDAASGAVSALAAPASGGVGILKNLAIGSAAGAGAGYGSDVGGPVGGIAGGLLGGVAIPSVGGISGMIYRATQGVKDAFADPGNAKRAETISEKMINRQIKDAISGTPSNEVTKNITEALALKEKLGSGFNPSVAEMANSPGLVDMQRKYSLLNPTNLNAEVARDAANKVAVRSFYEGVAPEASTGPGGIRSAVNQALSGESGQLSDAAQKVAGQLPKVDQLTTGKTLTQIAEQEKKLARPEITKAYEDAFNLDTSASIDAKPILNQIEKTLGVPLSQIKPETAPNTFRAIQRFVGGDGAKTADELSYLSSILGGNIENAGAKAGITLREASDLRRAVGKDATLAARSTDPLAATRLFNIGQVKNTIDEAINSSPVSQEAKDAFAAANKKYQTEFAPRFNEGTNWLVFKDKATNEPRILPDKLVLEYFKPDEMGGMTRANQFGKLFGKNSEATATTEKGILDLYRNDVINKTTGIIDSAKHDQFIKSYGRTLDAFKANGVNVGDTISSIGKQAADASRSIDKFNSLAKNLKFDSTDDLVSTALRDPKVMGNVTMRMNQEVLGTFKRIIMDKAWDGGDAAGMQKYLTDNQKTLRMVLPEKHLNDLSDIAKGLAIIERSPVGGTLASGGTDIVKNATGVSTATVWSQWRATTGGRQAPVTAVFNLAAPVLNKLSQQKFGDLMEKALYDPKTAEALRNFLSAQTPAEANMAGRILSGAKLAGGIAWDSAGALSRVIFGTGNYSSNLQRAAPAIAVNQLDQQR